MTDSAGTSPEPAISPTPDGPYHVTDLTDLTDSRGEPIGTTRDITLCRCGGSVNKPYCDLSHQAIGFHSGKSPDRVPDRMDHYAGDAITIHDNRGVCSHAGFCTDNSPAVFDRSREPWIDPNGDDAEKTAGTIRMCPSGALSYTRGAEEYKDQDRTPAVEVSRNGPYRVRGRVKLNDPTGNVPESREHYTLCRCGASKNKPFCDGGHKDAGFIAE